MKSYEWDKISKEINIQWLSLTVIIYWILAKDMELYLWIKHFWLWFELSLLLQDVIRKQIDHNPVLLISLNQCCPGAHEPPTVFHH